MPRVTPRKPVSKSKKPATKKPKRLTAQQLERRRKVYAMTLRGCATAAAIGALLVGYVALGSHVAKAVAVPEERPVVALMNRPVWMSDRIARDVAVPVDDAFAGLPSQLDQTPLESAYERLAANPWVRSVTSVRRVPDEAGGPNRVEIECEWRTPVAIVRFGGADEAGVYRLVADAEPEGGEGAIPLPLRYTADEIRAFTQTPTNRASLRVIQGVAGTPPEAGRSWYGADVRAGLDMALLLHDEAGASDVTVIDVTGVSVPSRTNTAHGDLSPVILRTRFGTEIYWGRPPRASDFLVEPRDSAKLAGLRKSRDTFAPAGKYPAWIDLRFEPVQLSREPN